MSDTIEVYGSVRGTGFFTSDISEIDADHYWANFWCYASVDDFPDGPPNMDDFDNYVRIIDIDTSFRVMIEAEADLDRARDDYATNLDYDDWIHYKKENPDECSTAT